VGTVGVVFADPGIQRCLGRFQRGEDAAVEPLTAQRQVEPLDLAGRGGRGRGGEPVGDAVLAADLVEQHLPALAEPIGELLTVVGQDLLGHPEPGQRRGQSQADCPAGGPLNHRGDDTEPGVVIDPGHDLGLAQLSSALIGDHDTADDVDLPQLHRARPLPAAVTVPGAFARPGHDQALPGEDPVNGPLRWQCHAVRGTAKQLKPDPFGSPPGMLAAHLRHHDLNLTRHPMRAKPRPVGLVRQPSQPPGQIPGDPRMHRLPRHPRGRGHLGDLRPRQNRTHRIQPLLDH